MEKIITSLLIIVAIIHLIPVTGVLGEERLASLYGLSFEEPNIAILMRHRAILFGLLGMFIVYAAFNKALQPLAFATGFISVISFILIAWEVDSYNEEIGRVVIADIIALLCLVVAFVLYIIEGRILKSSS